MKKENVRKITMLLLAMGLMGIGTMPAQAVELTFESLKNLENSDNFKPAGGSGTWYYPVQKGYDGKLVKVDGNKVTVDMGTDVLKGHNLAAGQSKGNILIIYSGVFGVEGGSFDSKKSSVAGVYNSSYAEGNQVYIYGGTFNQNVYGGEAKDANAVTTNNSVYMKGGIVKGWIAGGWLTNSGKNSDNHVTITGNAQAYTVCGGHSAHDASANTVDVNGNAQVNNVYGGYGTGAGTISGNTVGVSGNAQVSYVYGGYGGQADGNIVTLTGGIVKASVYGGYQKEEGSANRNKVLLNGNADVSGANLYGSNLSADLTDGNALIIDGWNSSSANGNAVKNVKNFNAVTFKNLAWENGGIALNITGADAPGQLNDTQVNVENLTLAGGTAVKAGDKMTFIQSNLDTGLSMDHVQLTEDTSFSQGVATVGELDVKLEGETNNLVGEIKSVSFNPQTDVIAENRTAAAAFLNQGADIAADSLDLLGSDYKYGLRTFGSVYGNRSTYDAAGDVKINGWSEIVGLGNVHRKGDGDLAWGVFYENGTGNYRTWNQFNNEMFRGDGSLRYNGGGAAVRYTQDSGWYYEASVRAGTLTASMENAVKDGEGNSYGFDNDSTYWGVHAGIGRLIDTGRGEWDLYGKYFHTDIEGSSFSIAKDRFVFDSLTSDRLRLGARYTADQTKQWSLYYGLGWEYEFSGDSHMRAAQWDAPEQSLGGSTGIAEIGTVWKPDNSPWQADINIKGYIGEREGFSGRVQLSYTF